MQYGADAANDLEILLAEGIEPNRIIIGGLDRVDAARRKEAFAVASRGAYVVFYYVGWSASEGYVDDEIRARLVAELVEEGLGERVLISISAVGIAKGHED